MPSEEPSSAEVEEDLGVRSPTDEPAEAGILTHEVFHRALVVPPSTPLMSPKKVSKGQSGFLLTGRTSGWNAISLVGLRGSRLLRSNSAGTTRMESH